MVPVNWFCSAAKSSSLLLLAQAVLGEVNGLEAGKTVHGRDCTSQAVLCLQDK